MTNIVAIGAGRMGRGIAQVFAYAGYEVSIVDYKKRSKVEALKLLDEAKKEVSDNLDALHLLNTVREDEINDTLERIKCVPLLDSDDVLAGADYIFEGVPEVITEKEDALGRLSGAIGQDTVIASTTSTMLSTQLAKFTTKPSHFLNAHFLNPAYLIPLVEVSPSEYTAPDVTDRFVKLLEKVGKVPVKCSPSPGYIVPRLQSLICSEACRMVEEGVASAEDIDRAVTAGFGIRFSTMGPLEFVDWGGLDILYYANSYLRSELGERFKTPEIVDEHMEKGNLGLQTGKGMYDFSNTDIPAYKAQKLARFVALLSHLDLMPKSSELN
jgi:3-hydroxybutyryl-CoA dehydrogenase